LNGIDFNYEFVVFRKKNILGSGDRFQNAANAAAANVNSGNPNPGIEDFGNSVLNELRSGKIFVYPIMSTAKIIKKHADVDAIMNQ